MGWELRCVQAAFVTAELSPFCASHSTMRECRRRWRDMELKDERTDGAGSQPAKIV